LLARWKAGSLNRSKRIEAFAGGCVVPGEAVPASRFDHPVHGLVACPGAPVLAGAGLAVRVGPVTALRHRSTDAVHGEVRAVTYLDPLSGEAVGLAVLCHRADVSAVAEVIDATCPLVAGGHAAVREYSDRGDLVVLIGKPVDAAAASYARQAAGPVGWAGTPAEVAALPDADPERVSFVVQPGAMTVPEAAPVLAAPRARFPRLRGQHPDGWCCAATDRAAQIAAIAGQADLVLECGPHNDHRAAASGLAAAAAPVVTLSAPVELASIGPERLAAAATIAVVEGGSAPVGLAEAVVTVLSGLGPCSVAEQSVTSRVRPRPAGAAHAPVPGFDRLPDGLAALA